MDERTNFTSRRQSPSFRHGMKWKAGPSGGVESRSLTPFVIFGTNSPPCGGTGSQEREPSPELAALTSNRGARGVAMFWLLDGKAQREQGGRGGGRGASASPRVA